MLACKMPSVSNIDVFLVVSNIFERLNVLPIWNFVMECGTVKKCVSGVIMQ